MIASTRMEMRGKMNMASVKIVADSSADLLTLEGIGFACAPLKIVAGEQEFVDDAALDVEGMVTWFDSYKGKSKTSCPNPGDWLEAFGDADEVFCVTITSGLSGSYNAACVAKQSRIVLIFVIFFVLFIVKVNNVPVRNGEIAVAKSDVGGGGKGQILFVRKGCNQSVRNRFRRR